MSIKETIKKLIEKALATCVQTGMFPSSELPSFTIETPKSRDHGDYATNVAMISAPLLKKSPRKIAEQIIAHIPADSTVVEKVEIAGPGFINFFISQSCWLTAFEIFLFRGALTGSPSSVRAKR